MSQHSSQRTRLKPQERIITAFAESASGPGWGNSPVRVVVADQNGQCRIVYLQPEEQTAEMHTLYQISQAAHLAMRAAAENVLRSSQLNERNGK